MSDNSQHTDGSSVEQTVAVLGMGRMGAAMAGTLRRGGFEVVAYNRTRATSDRVAAATGARAAATAAEAASQADVVISSLADDAAVVAVYDGADGAASGLRPGTVVLETSTIDPETLQRIEPSISAQGATLLDAPVSGSVSLVESGGLTVMVGGPEEPVERVRSVLDTLAARVIHMGDLGTGATTKLAVNAIIHSLNVALSEALVLAEKAGVERTKAYEVFASGAAAAPFVLYKRAAFEDPDGTPVAFSLDLVVKDLDLILGLAERVGARMDQGSATHRVASRAAAAGLGDRDMSIIAEALRGK